MGGELLVAVSAAEARALKKKPAGRRKLISAGKPAFDLGQAGQLLDLILEEVSQEKGLAAAGVAVSLEDDIGCAEVFLRHLSPARVQAVSAALAKVPLGLYLSLHESTGLSREEFDQLLLPLLRDLGPFYKRAAADKAAIVRVIY